VNTVIHRERVVPKMRNSRKIALFRYTDILCIAITVAMALIFLLFARIIFQNKNASVLAIEANGSTEYYSLNEDRTVEIKSEGFSLTVTIAEGSAYISHSDCPDGICKTMGKISKNGQIAICAPARVAISVNSENGEEDTDAITR